MSELAGFALAAVLMAQMPGTPQIGPQRGWCLPPGVPALDTMRVVEQRPYQMKGQRDTESYSVMSRLYVDPAGHEYAIFALPGGFAIVDDHPRDSNNTDWWIDPTMVTDEAPPRATHDPHSTCAWRRRANG
jgi:hypothetical protein